MGHIARLGLGLFFVFFIGCGTSLAEGTDYSRYAPEQLIDELMRIDQPAPGLAGLGVYESFIAEDKPPKFFMGVLGVKTPEVPPPMRELVRRGVKALPALIAHLNDYRPTHLIIGEDSPNFFFMFRYYATEYDPRHMSPGKKRDPYFRNGEGLSGGYNVKVGDVCYVLIGQIVNRNLIAVRYQPTGGLVVNSPTQTPILAEELTRDWSGLDTESHATSLLEDLKNHNDRRVKAALVRLHYYYPRDYDNLAGEELAKRQEFEAGELGFEEQANKYSRQHEYSKAVEEWTKWITHAPNSAEGYRRRGHEYDQAGKFKQALKDYNQAIKLEKKPNSLDTLFYNTRQRL